jgi:hypothetical protein
VKKVKRVRSGLMALLAAMGRLAIRVKKVILVPLALTVPLAQMARTEQRAKKVILALTERRVPQGIKVKKGTLGKLALQGPMALTETKGKKVR